MVTPSDQLSINKLESVQHNLVDRIRDYRLAGLSYWEKMQELRLYSQERRRERYQVFFLWKISQGMVSGTRRGRSIVPNPIVESAPVMVRKAREQSLGVRGA
jgi:hypothetical protein